MDNLIKSKIENYLVLFVGIILICILGYAFYNLFIGI